jgi:hypothetical protein
VIVSYIANVIGVESAAQRTGGEKGEDDKGKLFYEDG